MNNTLSARDLQYTILNPKFCNKSNLPLLEKIYAFWYDGWSKVHREIKSGETPDAADFFRQDFVTAISHEESVIGIHFYSLYDFRSPLIAKVPYVAAHFNSEFVTKCQELGYQQMMSMEGLLANPAYRKRVMGVGFTELLASLGQRLFLEYTNADCIFTPTRVDNKTSASAQKIGLRPLIAGTVAHNVPIDYLVCEPRDIIPPAEPVRFFHEHLWKNREATGLAAFGRALPKAA